MKTVNKATFIKTSDFYLNICLVYLSLDRGLIVDKMNN